MTLPILSNFSISDLSFWCSLAPSGTGSKPHLLRWPWSKAPQTLSCEDPVVQEKFRCQVSTVSRGWAGLDVFWHQRGGIFMGGTWIILDYLSKIWKKMQLIFLASLGRFHGAEPVQAPNIDKTDWPVQWLPWLETCHWDESITVPPTAN